MYKMNPANSMLVQFTYVVLLSSLMGNSFGLYIGNLSSDHKTVVQIMPLFFVPFLILAGFMANTAELFWLFKWMGYISPFKYMMEILLRAEFDHFAWGPMVRKIWDYDLGLPICYSVIIGYIALFRVLTYVWISRNVKKFN